MPYILITDATKRLLDGWATSGHIGTAERAGVKWRIWVEEGVFHRLQEIARDDPDAAILTLSENARLRIGERLQ